MLKEHVSFLDVLFQNFLIIVVCVMGIFSLTTYPTDVINLISLGFYLLHGGECIYHS